MRPPIALFSLIAFLAWVSTASIPRDSAQAAPGEATAIRPFLKTEPSLEAANQLAAKAAEGDAKAKGELVAAGLTFLPALQRIEGENSPEAHDIAHNQLRANEDWVKAMLGWELALSRPFPVEALTAYGTLKSRFQNPEAQLARAILHAAQSGDETTRKKLIEASPNSVWVKAAEGWQSASLAPKDCVERLLAVLPALLAAREFPLRIEGVDLQDRDLADLTREEWLEIEFGTPSGATVLRAIHSVPLQWAATRFCERIGALCTESGDPKLAESVKPRIQMALAKCADASLQMRAFLVGVNPEDPKHRSLTDSDWDNLVAKSCGPALVAYASQVCGADRPMERAAASIAAFRIAPDLAITQRACLRECLANADEVMGRIAIRMLLALRDDMHDALTLLCAQLMYSKKFSKELDVLRAAMEASKNAKLVALAKAVKAGEAAKLPNGERAKLALPVATRALFISAFAHPDEIKAYGGNEGVYWFNLGMALYGVRANYSGSRAFWEAIDASLKLRPKDPIHPVIYEYRQAHSQFLSEEDMAAEDAAFAAAKPAAAKANETFGKEIVDNTKNFENCALTAAQALAREGSSVLPEELEKILLEKNERWGAQGLCIVGDLDLLAGKYARRKLLFEKAERMGPLVRRVHYYQSPRKDSTGTYGLANFEVAARSVLRMLLVEPLGINVSAMLISVGLRTGQGGLAAAALLHHCRATCADVLISTSDESAMFIIPAARADFAFHFRKSRATFGHQWPQGETKSLATFLINLESLADRRSIISVIEVMSRRGYLSQQALRTFESHGEYWMSDVNELLNLTIHLWRHEPNKVMEYFERASELGISEFGVYVGSQGCMAALGAAGKFDEALKLYSENRKAGQQTSSLDVCLLIGLLHTNGWQNLKKALEVIAEQEWARNSNPHDFALRRALMALGMHERVLETSIAQPRGEYYVTGIVPYSMLFHEVRGLLDAGNFAEIITRTEPYFTMQAEDGLGVYADAALLKALAMKESGQSINVIPAKKTLSMMEENYVSLFMTTPSVLDWHVLQILSGKESADALPKTSATYYWHGTQFTERAFQPKGSGTLTDAEALARDSFIRGLLAYLTEDKDAARKSLEACIKADQRCAYEYHVAEWLLANRLK